MKYEIGWYAFILRHLLHRSLDFYYDGFCLDYQRNNVVSCNACEMRYVR